jgi:hypothetical protein
MKIYCTRTCTWRGRYFTEGETYEGLTPLAEGETLSRHLVDLDGPHEVDSDGAPANLADAPAPEVTEAAEPAPEAKPKPGKAKPAPEDGAPANLS